MTRNGQIEPVSYMTHAMDLIRDYALYWPDKAETDFRTRYLKASGSVTDANELHNLVNRALNELNDGHSRLITPTSNPGRAPKRPEGKLDNGVAVLSVPACILPSQVDAQTYANDLARQIGNLARSEPLGWVIDLRSNFGGNMWPMLAGLYPLTGPGVVGAFIDREGRRQAWMLSWGSAFLGDQIRCSIKAELALHQQNGRIAVLTDTRTASSGEAIATAFRGWSRARSFGNLTAGLSTANSSFEMPDGCTLAITSGVFMDRKGNAYGGPLTPDELVDWLPGSAVDHVMEEANAWLRTQA